MAKAGSIYKQPGSKFYWIKFYPPNTTRPIRESTKTTDYDEAEKYLWRRLGEVATGKFAGLEPERVKVGTLLDMLEENYEINGRTSIREAKIRIKRHLRPEFGGLKAVQVGTRQISAYITKRKKAGAKNATINRELELLRRAFTLGYKAQPQLVQKILTFEKLSEDNIREGLLDHAQYEILRDGLKEPYRTFFICGYHLGTRAGELIQLQWANVDFERKEIVLRRYTTKTRETRTLPIYGEMEAFLFQIKETRNRLYPDCPWVFQRQGKRMNFVHRLWRKKMVKLGVPGLLFHDLRRTAATNMLEAGFSEKEAMLITGHKTDRMLRRYQIVRRQRIQDLGARMEKFYAQKSGHSSGHSADKTEVGRGPQLVDSIGA